jgi:ribosome-associated protein
LKPGLSSQDKVREGLSAALDRKASAVLVFNLTELTTMADYFVLSTARSDRQARAISDAITERLGAPLSVEGLQTARWILMDYGDVVFHVFQEEARRFYALERLWGDAPNETGFFGGAGGLGGASAAPEESERPH